MAGMFDEFPDNCPPLGYSLEPLTHTLTPSHITVTVTSPLLQLSPRRRHQFLWLLDRCRDIQALEPVNRMSPKALAVVVVPNLFTDIQMVRH